MVTTNVEKYAQNTGQSIDIIRREIPFNILKYYSSTNKFT